jgi:hypothetical protein
MATMPTKAKDFIVNFMVLLTSKNDHSMFKSRSATCLLS